MYWAALCILLIGSTLPVWADVPAAAANARATQLRPVPIPDLTQVEGDVRLALQKARDQLEQVLERSPDQVLANYLL